MTDKRREYEREYKRRMREKYKPIYDEFMKLYPFTLEDLPGEVWKVVPNFEDRYQCSNFGRVKSFWNDEAKILKPRLTRCGYLGVSLCKDGNVKHFRISRLVAELFIPNPENKPQVNHLHGRFNNYFGSLEWVTNAENTQHAYDTGLNAAPQGEDHYKAKLSDAQVEYIRNNPDNLNTYQLAEKFGVAHQTISRIQLGKKYKNADGQIRQAQKRIYLSEKKREEVREKFLTGKYTQCQLAEMFGVSRGTIQNIINEK